ncbi:MAG: hypothetical protein UX91_C0006G0147 [Candidatus Amesbacteria bacterium GW2011_GWB1_47_19]|nr:MAG: hypothetical protein UW51_C0002G0148 [Candidatus Amesbacteria bacterium GW2011_GWA1_44_24]KKU31261.1 MAG: hypothetical protein UX46_C0006G0053 [Candidatus Amesbacteria bacterium GW2011_GWC1_46_24]KKU67085.1 MAG: hypothetical protein UX91_C0006G0147 [Candidatus Amesbacteria bacterium GW2011_GWB1_47_19]OGD04926.1 MAG: hypothetical protein A2379_04065 [Candidatus Amesbacteria bacterium RIFOXYB1_FULL_47_13]HBC72953.1 hypothetical protein [Candidatus Amesbacteria bacterium]
MSPIDENTIRVEQWTDTRRGVFRAPGHPRTQVLAEGDSTDPGSYVYERGVMKKNVGHIKNPDLLIDVPVDHKTGKVSPDITIRGLWRRFKEG